MKGQPQPDHETEQANKDHEKSLYAALRHAEEEQQSSYHKARRYFNNWQNRVAVLTLLFVAAYTVVTYNAFFVGYRAFIYFDKAVIEVLDKPIPPESNGNITVFNGPWVTQKVISANFLLTNAGNTPTKNMRVILDCRPIG